MRLSPKEIEKLMLHNAGNLAQKRLARGLRLNQVEAVALIASQLLEFIRDGTFDAMHQFVKCCATRRVLNNLSHQKDVLLLI